MLKKLYSENLSLLTDLYQLTMAYGYWKSGRAEDEAVFNMFFRTPPFKWGYAIAAGLAYVVDFLVDFQFIQEDLEYLSRLTGNNGENLFEPDFIEYLKQMKFECNVKAIEEGRAVFPNEPLLRVEGPIIQCQLIETPLLNVINFQTLIATKSARISQAARGEPVLEFGLRRAQGIDGALAASRAAYIGGCAATSNVLAGKLFDIPVKGTHAHSWVMAFDDELQSFEAYARAMPNNCVFLVDTYDSLEGVKKAVGVGRQLRDRGYKMAGIRLDSGDLAYLSIEARKMLDEAGFNDAAIVASNDLDEYLVEELKGKGATIGIWGIGTRLVTGYDQSALGGVYKLSAIRGPDRRWQYKLKLSEQKIKTSTPGILQVRRYRDDSGYIGDMVYDEEMGMGQDTAIVDQTNASLTKGIKEPPARHEDLLIPIFHRGKPIYDSPSLETCRQKTLGEIEMLNSKIRRLKDPHPYPVGLAQNLHDLKEKLIREAAENVGI